MRDNKKIILIVASNLTNLLEPSGYETEEDLFLTAIKMAEKFIKVYEEKEKIHTAFNISDKDRIIANILDNAYTIKED